MPSVEDAGAYIVDRLRDSPSGVNNLGCDLWIALVCTRFAEEHGTQILTPNHRDQITEDLSAAFVEAAWNLCRMGVLRPGTAVIKNTPPVDNAGYTVTEFGRRWLKDCDKPAYIPTDIGRLSDLLTRRQDLFGPVYVLRAMDAARCYSAQAYYACCAMIGAAAESILVASGIGKLGEAEAMRLYRGVGGRKNLTDALLKGCPEYVNRDFRLHIELISLWRDQSAHAHSAPIGEAEAFTNMRGLIKFAQFAEERWQHLTVKAS